MRESFAIGSEPLSIPLIERILLEEMALELTNGAIERIEKARAYLDEKMAVDADPIYGINTGFGSLYNVTISKDDLSKLQENLVMSHACGMGEEVPSDIVRIMLLLKIQSLSYGYSGAQLSTVKRLIDFYNEDVLPVVYQQGSLGASGDLAPLAHLALPLLGKGEVMYQGDRMPAAEALAALGMEPIVLQSKEGLALLNGTQFMAAYGTWELIQAHKLLYVADLVGALSLEAYDGRPEPFDERVHLIRPHSGQLKTAQNIRDFLEGSELIKRVKTHVQDPYSFRCMPQVHGASKDAIRYVTDVLTTEINSATDNPNVFPEDNAIISAGNFHGQPLALALDHLAIAMAEIGNISERRVYQLIGGKRGLPPFLVAQPGLNSGFMIPQYTAASIVSQSKQLCSPASVDSIESSNGQEDHVSMGANAATKAYRVIENTERVLAIECMNASQALAFREEKTSEFLSSFVEMFRSEVPFVEVDRILHNDIVAATEFIQGLQFDPELIYA
ncbi:histidine ammonia-lyase [Phaeocystidibacter marisrubri]|uniref:Histidine ammonia-lyase n=1 Tax=Phaeocystidibacter marisrubri TaxID=1577780 RepID=A0A6L3ZJY2_9FLAO|nr:histidine ammonia-lyase [Phaeocystidibacter marisrubri]KAB2817868.1 histidine ammonia-lyase [Phaeocystidibacter marisrubri]